MKKSKKWVKSRHKIIFAILRLIFAVFLFLKYGYRFSKFKCKINKPYLIFSNHVTTLDPFMVSLSFNEPVYFVASDHLFSLKYWSPLIKYLVAPIPKSKSVSDFQTIKDCIRVASQGGNICVFPEGNRTYNGVTSHIPFSAVKLVRMLKLSLLLYKIEGGYGVQPRWAGNIRRGKMYGGVFRAIEYEDYKNMSDDELYKFICGGLYANAFSDALTSGCLYKSDNKTKYIERFLYACPDCGKFAALKSQGNFIKCAACGFCAEYGENLKLKTLSGKCPFENLKEWDDYQKDKIREFEIDKLDKDQPIFSDTDISLKENIRCKKNIDMGKGAVTLYKDRFEISSDSLYVFYIADISSMGIIGKNSLLIYHKDKIYRLDGDHRFNSLKYQNMYYHIKNKIEGTSDGFLGL